MAKKTNTTVDTGAIMSTLAEKREALRALRFSALGGKNRNVKQAATLRKEIARAMTELSSLRRAK